ncbi:uncharacterized protein FFUJ_13333 [Fusarium fujikuroi IMI 58289]|uniref:Uncharacterized protein n=1 Tax=Gibberella fujikuroi (strain CBS 195.34 / IMI 58289 / NRRL A-6831) TaxID=1279085 RepID=S0DXG5_GIBF5|nr:uncharacterized protein FFUJ_13333 [Fusarium fujikuroi IMI 58289]KLO97659.1 uncharacterized protein LW94_13867 [Fusarium fujikuroi]CCT67145.1 uncharacterized protein FFUJ_13333 [Fusarium fujikuroi IMI 58289]SCN96145.1 uncharacterized protein FFM5_06331 [Fusarium fujikuroi]
MASQGRDRLILREEIISDDKVASSRHPNTVLHNHRMLRKEEKLALIQHAREYAWVLVHQRGQTTANSKKLLKKFYAEIFLHWSTSQRRNPNPSSTYPEDLQTLVGSIKKTCSKEAGNAITQKNGWSIVPGRIEFEPGLTVNQAKINAIHNYDNHERRRISSYNTQHIICATRSILVKWAARGSEGPLKLESEDMVSRIQPLVLASDLARYMAFTYSQIVEDMDGGSEDRTDDPDSD